MAGSDDADQSPAAMPRVPTVAAEEPAAEPLGSELKSKSLVDGLLYPSEDDRPFDIIDWPAGPVSAHLPAGARVRRMTPNEFFSPLRNTTDAKRFDSLHRKLAANLTDLAVYRVNDGSAEVNIYVAGRARDGRWGGVHTTSVET